MPSRAFVSGDVGRVVRHGKAQAGSEGMSGNYLIWGLNWLGDSVMSMPAIQMLKASQPDCRITVLSPRQFVPLWRMLRAVDSVIERPEGLWEIVAAIRTDRFDRVFIFPNSFRSALVPFLARIPVRVGMRGHQRSRLLTVIADDLPPAGRRHQAWEYAGIVDVQHRYCELMMPDLRVPEGVEQQALARLGDVETPQGWVGVIPGAARGPSKRWPAESFALVGRKLAAHARCRVMVLGAPGEVELCGAVAEGIGSVARNLAGETTLPEMAAMLRMCRVVICNDSGGMHLAAAVGTHVVAVYGMTDPVRTGPMGAGHRVIEARAGGGSRDIARRSGEASRALASVHPDSVCAAALELISA
jgi:heptosyltransferase II